MESHDVDRIRVRCFKKNNSINGRCNEKIWWERNNLIDLYVKIMDETSFLAENPTMAIRFYHILNGVSAVPCCELPGCNNIVKWHTSINAYSKYCSPKCTASATRKIGENNPFSHSAVKEKIRRTNLEKYGEYNYSKTKEFRSYLKTYHQTLSPEEKKKTQLAREKTNLLTYGHVTPLNNLEVKNKIKQTLVKRYGVDSPLKNADIKNSAKNTMLERYGRDHYNQQHISTDDLRNLKDRAWLENQLELHSAKEIARSCNISYSILCRYIRNAGIDLTKYSYFEKEVSLFIREVLGDTVEIETNNRKILSGKEIDIYIPSMKLGIECNGIYWHREGKGKNQNYHINKTVAAVVEGVRLVHIFENEWLEKRDIVENRLRLLLRKTERVYGRKCKIVNVASDAEATFLQDYHLQGAVRSRVCYGLTYNDELVAIMSFGKSRYSKKAEWELLRFAVKDNISVVGGAEKLFSQFIRNHVPNSVISYCDRRWFLGTIYSKLGFSFSHNSTPNYFYLEADGSLSSRVKYQKHKLKEMLMTFDPNQSEWSNMQNNGYDRIWDCGNSVWIWNRF